MKTPSCTRIFVPAALVYFATACTPQPATELESLLAERDSLRTVREQAEARIAQLDELIAALDNHGERTLITAYTPVKGTFRHFFEVYGNVESDRAATLYPEMPGLVQAIAVREGETVKRGQVLLRLDSEVLQRNMNELRTSLELAKTLYDKQQRLWEQNIGSEVQYLEAKNRKESLESAVATLQEQINKTVVRAPFDGVVDKIFPKIGEMASGQMPVARVVNNSSLYITAEVSERYTGKVKQGDPVEVIVNRTDTIQSRIARVGAYINPANRTFEIRVDLETAYPNLKPNSLVMLKINDYSVEDAVAIPSSLIMQDGEGRDYVFLVKPNGSNQTVAVKQPIAAGQGYLGQTLVLEGVEPGVPIIDKGSRSVRHGDPVEISNI